MIRIGSTPESLPAYQLSFIDPSVGWVRTVGRLWRTESGGATWREITSPNKFAANNVIDYHFVGVTSGWARGYDALYSTSDSGKTWRRVQNPAPLGDDNGEIDSIFPLDSNRAWVGGGIYRIAPPGQVYFDNSAVDQLSHPLRVLQAAMFVTQDGGKNWHRQRLVTDEYRVRKIIFFDDRRGFATTDESVYWTSTGGESWQRSLIKIKGKERDYRLNVDGKISDVFMLNEREGWLLFGDGHICKTINGGRLWSEVLYEFAANQHPRSKLAFFTPLIGWGSDEITGTIYETRSGGKDWHPLNLGVTVADFFVLNEGHAWVIGDRAVFLARP